MGPACIQMGGCRGKGQAGPRRRRTGRREGEALLLLEVVRMMREESAALCLALSLWLDVETWNTQRQHQSAILDSCLYRVRGYRS